MDLSSSSSSNFGHEDYVALLFPIASVSLDSRISIEPYAISLDSRISVEDYNEIHSISEQTHNSINQNIQDGSLRHSVDEVDDPEVSSSTGPLRFERIPRHVSAKRFDFLTSERQLIIDSAKNCCLSECLSKIGRRGLKQIRLGYLSLNGEEQDTFLAGRLQLLQDLSARNKVSFEYYLNISDRCC